MKWEQIKLEFLRTISKQIILLPTSIIIVPLVTGLLFPDFFSSIPWLVYVILITLLSFSLVFVSVSYLSLKKKHVIPFKHWTFDERKGLWTDGKYHYCPSCKANFVVSPMKVSERGWLCMIITCRSSIANPDYKDPLDGGSVRSDWVNNF